MTKIFFHMKNIIFLFNQPWRFVSGIIYCVCFFFLCTRKEKFDKYEIAWWLAILFVDVTSQQVKMKVFVYCLDFFFLYLRRIVVLCQLGCHLLFSKWFLFFERKKEEKQLMVSFTPQTHKNACLYQYRYLRQHSLPRL